MPRLYSRECDNCHIQYKSSNPRYCSWSCYTDSRWVDVVCRHCSKSFRARRIYINRGQMKYCSVTCSRIASRTVEGIFYRGERYTKNANGYFSSSRGNGKILHRVIWQDNNGSIPDGYVVHHKDENKENNDISNLELKEWGEHTALHHSTGRTYGYFACIGCGIEVKRLLSYIKIGQNKFCTKRCANKNRKRNKDGTFN